MKKNILILFLLGLSACSPKENNQNFENKIEALAIFTDTSTALADFGNPVTASTTRIFTFKNTGDTAGSGTATLTGANAASFSIVLQTGCATVNVGSTCTVRVNFNPAGKAIGSYTADLNIGGTPLKTLTATVAAATTGGSTTGGTSGGSGTIEASISGVVISNPLDYGSFSGTQSSTKIIRLTNKGTSSVGPHTAALSDGDFTFTLNSCSSKTLAPNAYCDVRVTFSASSKTAQDYLTDLTFAGSTFPLKATVASSTTGGSATGGGTPDIAILDGTNPVADPLNYGTFSGTQSLTKILTIKNNGTSSVVVNPTLGNTDFTFTLNACSNKTLAPNGTCSVRVTFSASGKSSGAKTTTMVVHPTKSLALEATVTGGVTITYQLEYSSYGTCSAANACNGVGTQTRTATCRQLNNGIPGGTVALSNCPAPTLSQTCNSPAGTKPVSITGGTQTVSCLAGSTTETFESVVCDSGYFIDGQICSADVITYSPTYSDYSLCSVDEPCEGVGEQTRTITQCDQLRNGNPDGTTDLSNCAAFDIPVNTTLPCDSPQGNKTNTIAHGSIEVSCLAGSSIENFFGINCDPNYQANGQVSCDPIPATISTMNIATDNKSFVITGSYFDTVYSVKLLKASDQSVVDTLNIRLGRSNSSMEVEPSTSNLLLNQDEQYILRLEQ